VASSSIGPQRSAQPRSTGNKLVGGRSETTNNDVEANTDWTLQSSPMKRQGGSGQPHWTVLVGSK
jgi:hypothetical protein